jgi:small subunit ribosomal protein S16
MLKIRLARAWKRNTPFFRVVLTEHTKATKHWYTEVLWFYNPISKEFKIKNIDKVKKYIGFWAKFSPRVEKLININKISL